MGVIQSEKCTCLHKGPVDGGGGVGGGIEGPCDWPLPLYYALSAPVPTTLVWDCAAVAGAASGRRRRRHELGESEPCFISGARSPACTEKCAVSLKMCVCVCVCVVPWDMCSSSSRRRRSSSCGTTTTTTTTTSSKQAQGPEGVPQRICRGD